jgi:PAS domain S-box-containing protein
LLVQALQAQDEAARLRELYGLRILDTAPDAEIDRLAATAKQICGAPIALVSLSDSTRQWFKAKLGLDACEIPRSGSFCGQAILQRDVFVVTDALKDKRFAACPLVTAKPRARFYAGAPLVTASGHTLGTLCVIDTTARPKGLLEHQKLCLQVLGEQVVKTLEHRRQVQDLRKDNEERESALRELAERETQYRLLVEQAPDVIFRTDAEGRFTYINATATRILQRSKQEILGIPFTDVVRADARAAAQRFYFKQSRRRTTSTYYEFPAVKKDGTEIWFGQHVQVLIEDNRVTGFQGIARDVTDRKRAEEKLRESRQQIQTLLEASNIIIQHIAADGRFLYTNRAWHTTLGHTAEEMARMTVFDVVHPESREQYQALFQRVLSGQTLANLEFSLVAKDGRRVYVAGSATCERTDGRPTATRNFLRDITERRLAEEGLRESESRLRQVVESSPSGIAILDRSGNIAMVNASIEKMFGYSRTELTGGPISKLAPERLREGYNERLGRYLSNPSTREMAGDPGFLGRRRDGSEFPAELSLTPIQTSGGIQILATVIDITARRRAEESLKNVNVELEKGVLARTAELQAAYQQLNFHLENTPLGMIHWAPDLKILHWSRQAQRIFGWTAAEVEDKGIEEWPFIADKDREAFRGIMERLIRGQERRRVHRVQQLARDGQEVHCVWHTSVMLGTDGQVMSMMALVQDLSEQVRLEQQFHQAQKMEAIGRLAGGIAHDFNNLLTVINGYSDMLVADTAIPASVKKAAEQILYAGERASGLTNQLLAFSRQQVLRPRRLQLNNRLQEMEKLLRRLIGEDIRLMFSLDASPDSIEADPGQIDQLVINLAVNARDAMSRGGCLTLKTGTASFDKAMTTAHGSTLQPGAYVTLTVSDTGTGIDDRTLRRIFEPFFTTKGTGKGTGLGLATVHGIMQQSGGTITVQSRLGEGSSFQLYFPAVESSAPLADPLPPPSPLLTGSETVLLVEDEPIVRAFTREVLVGAGYTVLEVGTAEEAKFLSNGYEARIHLLLTDVILPVGRGTALAEELSRRRTDMQILLMSGYIDQNVTDTALAARLPFIQKPFTGETLLQRVREVLDSGSPGVSDAQLTLF